MWLARAARAWVASAVSCVCFVVLWALALPLFFGSEGRDSLRSVIDGSLAFGSVFAVTAAVVYVPVFAFLSRALRQGFGHTLAILLGVALAPIAYAAVAWVFHEREDPPTIWAWILYWAGHIPEFLIFTLPFALAGVVFGVVWSTQGRRARPSADLGRGR